GCFVFQREIHGFEIQGSLRRRQSSSGSEIVAHCGRQLEDRGAVGPVRILDLRIEFPRLQRCRSKRSPVYGARCVARLFAREVFVHPLALRSSQLLERAIVKGGVKSCADLMQLIDNRDIQLLCGDQHFDFSAPQGGWNCRVKEWLPEGAFCQRKRLRWRLSWAGV